MLTENSLMPFGKHKGEPMRDVPVEYLNWLWNENGGEGDKPVMNYIRENLDELAEKNPELDWD